MRFHVNDDASELSISVIVPVYNMADKLDKALDSVLAQTLSNVEIVCVDDGSTDGSLALLHEYAARDSRIVVVAQENAGPGPARNAGMKEAHGEFIFFLDPDDWLPNDEALERLYFTAQRTGAKVVGGNIVQTDDEGRSWGLDTRRAFTAEGWLQFSQVEDCYGYWRYLFDRVTLVGNKTQFPAYRRGQDPVFMTRVMDAVDDYYAITLPVYSYRKGVGHVKWSKEKIRDHYLSFGEVLAFSARHGYRYMHSTAIPMNRELLVSTFQNASDITDPCVTAMYKALGYVDPSLLLNKASYDAFVRECSTYFDLLANGTWESRSKLDNLLSVARAKSKVRSALIAALRRTAPLLSWELQKRHAPAMGNYDAIPSANKHEIE